MIATVCVKNKYVYNVTVLPLEEHLIQFHQYLIFCISIPCCVFTHVNDTGHVYRVCEERCHVYTVIHLDKLVVFE